MQHCCRSVMMGEYARIQMAKKFRVHLAVRDHMRDKHGAAAAPAVGAA